MLTCAVTGHRPQKFSFRDQEQSPLCLTLKNQLFKQFTHFYTQGVRRFYIGGALGVDMWAGEILLRMKSQAQFQELELIVALPFAGYCSQWDETSKARLTALLRDCTQYLIISKTPGDYKTRNYYLVDHADILLAIYDQAHSVRSGTGQTVNYAKKRGIPIIFIHPDTGAASIP